MRQVLIFVYNLLTCLSVYLVELCFLKAGLWSYDRDLPAERLEPQKNVSLSFLRLQNGVI